MAPAAPRTLDWELQPRLRALLALAEPVPYTPTTWGMADTSQFSCRNADLARGAVWAVCTHTDDATAALLAADTEITDTTILQQMGVTR